MAVPYRWAPVCRETKPRDRKAWRAAHVANARSIKQHKRRTRDPRPR